MIHEVSKKEFLKQSFRAGTQSHSAGSRLWLQKMLIAWDSALLIIDNHAHQKKQSPKVTKIQY
jgi:hypothetical protein